MMKFNQQQKVNWNKNTTIILKVFLIIQEKAQKTFGPLSRLRDETQLAY